MQEREKPQTIKQFLVMGHSKKILRATLGGQQFEQTDGRSGFSFLLRIAGGRLEFVMQAFGDSPKLSSSGLAFLLLIRCLEFIASYTKNFYQPKGLYQYSVLNSMCRSGLVNRLVTHANIEGFGLTPFSGDRRGYMPPLVKTKQLQPSKLCMVTDRAQPILNELFHG